MPSTRVPESRYGLSNAGYDLDRQTFVGDAAGSGQAESNPLVCLRGASVRIAGRAVWEHVDLDVWPGEFIAILGPNGAGKSTLLNVILGLTPISTGSVTVFGRPARRGQARIGYVPQRRHFDADTRVRGRDIVRLGLDGANWGLPVWRGAAERERRRRVERAIAAVGAAAFADRPIGELSGGEQQRLLIAQALVTDPHMLVLDEPLESLDITNQQTVAGIIRGIAHETKAAVLLVAHDVNPILRAIDRVVYIARGRIAVGPPEEVINTQTLSDLYGSHVEVLTASDGSLVVVGHPGEEHVLQHDPS